MKNAMAPVLALLALSLTAVPPVAAAGPGVVTTADGRAEVGREQTREQTPVRSQALKEIYSTFNTDPGNRYNCCVAYAVSTRESGLGRRYSIAAPFTPAQDAVVRKIVVAMYWDSGANTLSVSLRADDGGLPGALLKQFDLVLSPWDGCCETETLRFRGVSVTAGHRYWLVARATGDTFAAWNWNSVTLSGPFARKFDSSVWEPADDVLPAFSILGE